jgi:hypothetical protein
MTGTPVRRSASAPSRRRFLLAGLAGLAVLLIRRFLPRAAAGPFPGTRREALFWERTGRP